MARVKRGVTSHARHKKVLKLAKGYRGRAKKRNFRALWIQRINAATRQHGMTYSQFMNGMKKAGIELDRKVLSDLAIREPEAFKALVEQAESALAAQA